MWGIITKINERLKCLLFQKGQGLVEFVLVLAFCAAIAWAARETGFSEAIGALLGSGENPEYVTAAIGGGEPGTGGSDNPSGNPVVDPNNPSGNPVVDPNNPSGNPVVDPNNPGSNPVVDPNNPSGDTTGGTTPSGGSGGGGWGWDDDRRLDDPITYYEKEDSKADRLKADQHALVNIAMRFMGLTQKQVKLLLKGDETADMAQNKDVTLGHFIPVIKDKKYTGGMKFETEYQNITLANGEKITVGTGTLNKSEQQNIFAWMQGIYTDINDPEVTVIQPNENYDPNRMYLVSDYVVSQDWADGSGSNQQNGLKLKLEYNYSGDDYNGTVNTDLVDPDDVVVVGVHLTLDPKSQDNKAGGTDYKEDANKGVSYNRMTSKGLDVQVRRDHDGNIYITQVDTAKSYRLVEETDDQGNPILDENGIVKTKLMELDSNGNLVKVSGGSPTSKWYGNPGNQAVENYIKNNIVATIDSNKTVTGNYDRGNIIKISGQYYIVTETGEQTINAKHDNKNYTNLQVQLEALYNLVKITGYRDNYWHENDYTSNTGKDNSATPITFIADEHGYAKRTYKIRGVPVILSTGEVYIYVGQAPWEYTGINDTDFIKIMDSTIEPWSVDSVIVP